ncbi:MAG: type III pantothenate kinase [Porticoccus sp.]
MILEIDVGNTRIKWRCLQHETVQARGVVAQSELDEWAKVIEQEYSPDIIRIACVGGRGVVDALRRWAVEWDCELLEAHTTKEVAGIRCGYDDPSTMGVDRWLAVVAAYRQFGRACVVVDVGSAVTVDLVDGGGQHLGGYIVPGFGMMCQSLFQGTDKVKVEGLNSADIGPGTSTREAVSHGGLLMVKAMVEQATKNLATTGEPVRIVVTGGDAGRLIKVLSGKVSHVPELVMDGLGFVTS